MVDEPKPYRTAFLVVLALVLAGLGAEYALAGRAGVEKLATALAMPTGMVWLILLWGVVAASLSRRPGLGGLLGAGAILLTLGGNELISSEAVQRLEAPYSRSGASKGGSNDAFSGEGETFGTVVILGGGVWETPSGQPEVNGSGDRVVTAARLYHAGRTTHLHCTGSAKSELSRLRKDEGELTRELLVDLGVPEEAVSIGAGANTSEELSRIAESVNDGSMPKPVALVTSAWHMGRVERLAKDVGVEIVPVPADFKSSTSAPPASKVLSIVPTADALSLTTVVAKEYLAGFVGR